MKVIQALFGSFFKTTGSPTLTTEEKRYKEKRKHIEKFVVARNLSSDPPETFRSPSGNYELTTSRYSTGPSTWQYSRGVAKHLADGKTIADIKRNYGHFWHAWALHPNGAEYLLCGEDYQGYSVINLGTGVTHRYFPAEGFDGFGFCWTAVHPSPDGLTLAVEGCIWGGPYEVLFLDFSNPESPPFTELARLGDLDEATGWEPDGTFVFEREFEARVSDGVDIRTLDEVEIDRLEATAGAIETKKEDIRWRRPVDK
jgi:hypothetical protein